MWLRGNVEEWWQEFQCDLWITFRLRGWRVCRSALPRVVAWGCVFRCRDSPRRGSFGDRGNDLECRGSAATERSSLRVSAGDFPDLDGRVPSVERQRAANGHRRRTRRRPWRSARVSLAVLRGFRPPEEPGTEPFSEYVRQLCESPLLELARGTRAVAMIRSSKNGSPPPPAWCACSARIACSARTRSRLRTPCSNSPRIEWAGRGRGQRCNSGAQFTLPLRGHSPGPSGLGGVYLSKLLRANIFRSTAGQGSVRSIAGSFWRCACRGVVHTVLRCSRTGFCTSRRETFESLKGVGKQWRKKTQTTREEHRLRARGVGG